jgi:uncharacterized protein (TIRG00374 family)
MSKHRLVSLLKWSVSLALIAWIVLKADFSEVAAAVNQLKPVPLAASALTMALGLFLRSCKWQVLLRVQGARIPLPTLSRLTFVSIFFNNFFLGSIGGDLFRYYETNSSCDSRMGAAASLIMERLTGLVTALFLVLLVGPWILATHEETVTAPMLVTLVVVTVGAGMVLVGLLALKWITVRMPVLRKIQPLVRAADDLSLSMRAYASYPGALFASLVISALFHVTRGVTVYLFVLAANANISFLTLFYIALLVGLIVLIPISINGLGIQEGSYIFYLEQAGVANAAALLVAAAARAMIILFSIIGGILFAVRRSEYGRHLHADRPMPGRGLSQGLGTGDARPE